MKPLNPDKPRKPKKSKFTSDSIDQSIGRTFILFWVSCLLIIIISVFCIFFLPMIKALFWQKTPCQIVKSEIIVERENDIYRRVYNVSINYQYVFNGQSFVGGKYNFDEYGSMLSPIMENIINKYPVGLKTNCYVNPNDPTMAVLYRGPYLHLLFCLMPVGMLIGGAMLYLNLRKLNKV